LLVHKPPFYLAYERHDRNQFKRLKIPSGAEPQHQWLKFNPKTANIPIILCSMSTNPKEIEKALKSGAAQFLRKPLKREELQACLDMVLERKA
jgi:CheY-like chemotaxis protein